MKTNRCADARAVKCRLSPVGMWSQTQLICYCPASNERAREARDYRPKSNPGCCSCAACDYQSARS